MERAGPGQIAFVSQEKYLRDLDSTRAGALILPPEGRDSSKCPRIITANPYLYFARVSALMNPAPSHAPGVHATAVVHPHATVAATATIDAGAVVGAGARIGERSVIGANCAVGEQVEILIEGTHPDSDLLLRGRLAGQAPEIDGQVIVNDGTADPGSFVTCEVTEAHPYDLVARVVGGLGPA